MKIIELEIRNVRGLPQITLIPNGKSFAIWGPNGSGKSGVVDALDFLLTGRISRLTGEGTDSITLSKHGPHIDHSPDEALVRALVQVKGFKDTIEIKRNMNTPNVLTYDPKFDQIIRPIIEIAERGQHVLTRRDILQFITSKAASRATGIQKLLNLLELEEIRKTFVKVENDFKRESDDKMRIVDSKKKEIAQIVGSNSFQEELILRYINDNRIILRGQQITDLMSTSLKNGLISLAALTSNQVIDTRLVESQVALLRNLLSNENNQQIQANLEFVNGLLDKIQGDTQLGRDISRRELTRLGLGLIDETENCPLCDTEWPTGKLKAALAHRQSAIEVHVTQLNDAIENIKSSLDQIADAATTLIDSVGN